MKELREIVSSKISEMLDDGSVEKIISENIEKTIKVSVEQALQSYSEFGRTITKKIESSVQCAGNDIEIPEYNIFIKQVIQKKFIEVMDANAVNHLSELVNGIIEPVLGLAKTSELMSQIEEAWSNLAIENDSHEIEVTSDMNEEGTALYVTFKGPGYEGDVKATFYNFKSQKEDLWHIGYINESGISVTGLHSNKARTHCNSATDILFKYYAMGTKFELDQEFEDIQVGEY